MRQQLLESLSRDFDYQEISTDDSSSEHKKFIKMKDEEIQALDTEIDDTYLKNAEIKSENDTEE